LTSSAKRKGDDFERVVQGWLRDHLGVPARRKLGAGRRDDVGDMDLVPNTTISCAAWDDLSRAVREKLPELVTQQARAGTTFGAMFVKRRGSFIVVMTPEQFAALWREAA
jgi:hypothetical protein